MEGKAILLKKFAGVDAFPICPDTKDVEEIILIVEGIAPVFGGINLEDISAPRCFEIERRLREMLDLPVFHHDPHGTAIVVLAALLNALKVVHKRLEAIKVVTGVGAAGIAVTNILLAAGVRDIIGCDRLGAIHRDRPGLSGVKSDYAAVTNPRDLYGSADSQAPTCSSACRSLARALSRASSGWLTARSSSPWRTRRPRCLRKRSSRWSRWSRPAGSDYPNQINNVLAFPGVFRGALDVHAREINEEMKVTAAHAIAETIADAGLSADDIVPERVQSRRRSGSRSGGGPGGGGDRGRAQASRAGQRLSSRLASADCLDCRGSLDEVSKLARRHRQRREVIAGRRDSHSCSQ